jgi:hypothetical protein
MIKIYQNIRKKEGDKAKSIHHLIKIYGASFRVRIYDLKISWRNFKKKAGFADDDLPTLNSLIMDYKKIYKEQGSQAEICTFQMNRKIQYYAKKLFNLSWTEFKNKAGFKSQPHPKDIEGVVQEYIKIRAIVGDLAKNRTWLHKNHRWIDNVLSDNKLKWDEFKKMTGFEDFTYNEMLQRIGMSKMAINMLNGNEL